MTALGAETEHERVGYQVSVCRREWYDGMGTDTDWIVKVHRLSDGTEIARKFAWRWRARRFGRSTRRISKAFDAAAHWSDQESESWVIEWPA